MSSQSRRFLPLATLLPLTFLAAPGSVAANVVPLIDIHAGMGYWQPDLSGDVASDGDDFDVEDDLDFDRNSTNILEVGVRHPIPLLPNARLRHQSLSDSATSTLQATRSFGPVEFQQEESVRSSYDLEMTDLTLYYRPWSTVVTLDFGITARMLDLDVEIESRDSGESESAGGSAVIPMGHLALRGDLPLTGLYASGELNIISASGNRLQDFQIGLGWESRRVFGVEAGYRQLDLKVDDVDDLDADLSMGGPYVAVNLRF
jgi:outer membrane protein